MSDFFVRQSTRLSTKSSSTTVPQHEGKSLVIGVLGSAIRFADRSERWSGQSEYYKLIWWACHLDSISQVFLISRTDLDKMSPEFITDLDPNKKIIQLNHWKLTMLRGGESEDKLRQLFRNLQDYVREDIISRGYRYDLGIMYMSAGAYSTASTCGYIPTIKDPNKITRVLGMTYNYNGPVFTFLNMSNTPWFMLASDPRYFNDHMKPRDIANLPLEVLGQYNETKVWKHIESYVDNPRIIPDTVEHRYAGIEKMNLINESIVDPGNSDRSIDMLIVANQVESPNTPISCDYRYRELIDWVLSYDKNNQARVYGRWDEDRMKASPQLKGRIDARLLDEKLAKTKVTFISPTKSGWATSKPWEMLRVGVLPLMHPHFDAQRSMFKAEHIGLYCLDPEDLWKKFTYYAHDHEEERIRLVRELQDMYIKDAVSGQFFTRSIDAGLGRVGSKFRIQDV
jgi:hypothetical protein